MTLLTIRNDSPQGLGTPPATTGTHPTKEDRRAEASRSRGRSTSPGAPKPTRFGFRRTQVGNWQELLPGDSVVLIGASSERVSGTVDAVSKDGDLVWIFQDNGAGRKLFHDSDNYQTFKDPKIS